MLYGQTVESSLSWFRARGHVGANIGDAEGELIVSIPYNEEKCNTSAGCRELINWHEQ
jgi:hypothetical protein